MRSIISCLWFNYWFN